MERVCKQDQISEQDFAAAVAWRRQLHKYAQPSWMEFFATGFVAEKLSAWGYNVHMGHDIISEDKLLLLPSSEKLEENISGHWAQALMSNICCLPEVV